MPDLTPLVAWLNSLGVYGMLGAAAVTLLAPKVWAWLKPRLPNLKLPTVPAPAPAPAPDATPLRDVLLGLLQAWLAARNPDKTPAQALDDHLSQHVGQLLSQK